MKRDKMKRYLAIILSIVIIISTMPNDLAYSFADIKSMDLTGIKIASNSNADTNDWNVIASDSNVVASDSNAIASDSDAIESDFNSIVKGLSFYDSDTGEKITKKNPAEIGSIILFRYKYRLSSKLKKRMEAEGEIEFTYQLPEAVIHLFDASYEKFIDENFTSGPEDTGLGYEGVFQKDRTVSIKIFEEDDLKGYFYLDIPVLIESADSKKVMIPFGLMREEPLYLTMSSVMTLADVSAVEPEIEGDHYLIESHENLQWIAEQVNSGKESFKGKTLEIMNDIELGTGWTIIGDKSETPFEGNVYGNGFTISNVGDFIGYYRADGNVKICDLSMEINEYSTKKSRMGGFADTIVVRNTSKLDIENCHFYGILHNEITWAGYPSCGSIAGYVILGEESRLNVRKCESQAICEIISGYGEKGVMGGYFGTVEANEWAEMNLIKSVYNGNLLTYYTGFGGAKVGGLIGVFASNNTKNSCLRVHKCNTNGSYTTQAFSGDAELCAGGFIGTAGMNNLYITESYSIAEFRCFTDRNVNGYQGGLVANADFSQLFNLNIKNCYTNCRYHNGMSCGGILGHSSGGNLKTSVIENCYTTTNGKTSANCAGIITYYNGNIETTVRNCYFDMDKLGIGKECVSCSLGILSTTWLTAAIENSYGLSTEEMKQESEYKNWNFNHIWEMGKNYPVLQDNPYLLSTDGFERIDPKEIDEKGLKLSVEFDDLVEIQNGTVTIINSDTEKIIDEIELEPTEQNKSSRVIEVYTEKIPYDTQISVLFDGDITVGNEELSYFQDKDEWTFHTQVEGGFLYLYVLNESGERMSYAKVNVPSLEEKDYTTDENGFVKIDVRTLNDEDAYLIITKDGYQPAMKKISDATFDSYDSAYMIAKLYKDTVPEAPSVVYLQVRRNSESKGVDVSQKEMTFYTNDHELQYVSVLVDWKGKTPGSVYLEQESKVDEDDEENKKRKRLELKDGGITGVALGEFFSEGEAVYAYAVADGKSSTKFTTEIRIENGISVSEQDFDKIKIGKNVNVKISSDVPVFGNSDIGFEYPGLPFTLSTERDKETGETRFIGIIGLPKEIGEKLIKNKNHREVFKEKIQESNDAGSKYIEDLFDEIWGDPVKVSKKDKLSIILTMAGYMEGFIENNQFRILESSISGKGEVKYKYPKQITLYPPVCGEVGFGASIEPKLGISDTPFTNARDLTVNGELDIKGKANVGVGLGVAEFFNGGIAGDGELNINHKYDFLQKLFGTLIEVEGKLSLKVQLLVFEYKKEIAKKKWTIYDSIKNFNKRILFDVDEMSAEEPLLYSETELTSDDFSLAEREYSSKPTEWSASSNRKSRSGGDKLNLLENNIYPDAKTKLISYDDKKMLIWSDDERGRSSVNRTILKYSIYDERNGWSQPKAVSDDKTADFDYDVLNADGEIYIVWQNIVSELSDKTTLDEMSRQIGISVAKFDKEKQEFTVLKNINNVTGSIRNMPRLVETQNGIRAVWIECETDNCITMEGKNTIRAIDLSGMECSEEKNLYISDSPIVQMTAAHGSNQGVLAFVWNRSAELNSNDYELCIISGDHVTQITDNNYMDSNPAFSVKDGRISLYYYSGDRIIRRPNVFQTEEMEVTDPTVNPVESSFEVWENNNKTSIIYNSVDTENEQRNLMAVTSFDDGITWGEENIINKGSEMNIQNFSGYMDSDGSYHTALIVKDEENSKLYIGKWEDYSDLQIVSEPFYLDEDLKPESDIPVSVKLRNNGTVPITKVEITVESDLNTEKQYCDVNLLSGKEETVDFVVKSGTLEQIEVINISVSASDCMPDINNEDNIVSLEWGKPDLAINNVEVIHHGEEADLLVFIENTAYQNVENAEVSLRLDNKEAEKLCSQISGKIDSMKTRVVRIPLSESEVREIGSRVIYVCVDSGSDESRKANNSYWLRLSSDTELFPDEPIRTVIELDREYCELEIGEQLRLIPTLTGNNTDDILWNTSNSDVVTVDGGVVTAINAGRAEVTAELADMQAKAVCEIVVSDNKNTEDGRWIPVTGVRLESSELYLTEIGKKVQLNAQVLPNAATNKTLVWSSDHPEIVSVNQNGVIISNKGGIANIIARSEDSGFYAVCRVAVEILPEDKEDEKESEEDIKQPEEDTKESEEDIKQPEEDTKEPGEDIKQPEDDIKEPEEDINEKPGNNIGYRKSEKTGKNSHGTWIKDNTGWWYRYLNGQWPSSDWKQLPYNHRISWYYFQEDGSLMTDGITPDGFYVGSDGAWIQ